MRPKTPIALSILALGSLALAAEVGAQEATSAPIASGLIIRRAGYRVGQVFRLHERSRQTFLLDLRIDGRPVPNTPNLDQRVQGEVGVSYKILAVKAGRVARCQVRVRQFSFDSQSRGGVSASAPDLQGTQYTYERVGADGRRILDDKGKAPAATIAGQLARLLPADPLDPYGPWRGQLPDRPLRIGERFDCPRELLPRFDLALGMGLKIDRIELTLLRPRLQQGRPCALFAVTIHSGSEGPASLEVDTRFRVRGVLLIDLATGGERLFTVSGPLRVRGAQNNSPTPFFIKGDGRLKLRRSFEDLSPAGQTRLPIKRAAKKEKP